MISTTQNSKHERTKMFTKILIFASLLAFSKAQHHQASSFISFNQNTETSGSSLSGGSSLGLGSTGSYGYIAQTLPIISSGVQSQEHYQQHKEPHAHPKYQYKYGVEDKHTGDIKSQEETRDGDVTKGSYSVHEPDGTILTVHYTVTKKSGFNAVVQRTGHAAHPQLSHH